ncbi:uncharacterized protein (DUF983 family) [Filimonas zeae]|uniref:DUF983 domain-containing protein n=1 Tax=Filimonas zeae TaxID=1737353 RepID=A0A917MSZ3_9BACT|nr:DUF983 domain-containing protein [Filimonas zeae]MDR6337473.1 uncharacterized protein (DUF983 family) [Filimonas zeae]GGH58798.1 hypothetical protein GCM10011379_04860 [Filimonas zeae]
MNAHDTAKPNWLVSVCHTHCPRCRRGDMFKDPNPYHLKSTLAMNESCPVCGQQFDIEVGFYYGTSYVSYAFSIAVSVASFIAWWVFIGFSLNDNRLFWWLGANALLLVALQPIFMRLARTIWLAFFVGYDKDWKNRPAKAPERVNDQMKNAW